MAAIEIIGDRCFRYGGGHIEIPVDVAAEIRRMQEELDRLTSANRELSNNLRNKDDWFVRQVIEFHEGCDSGKRDFIESCGLSVPTDTVEVTVTLEIDVFTAESIDAADWMDDAVRRQVDYSDYPIVGWDIS